MIFILELLCVIAEVVCQTTTISPTVGCPESHIECAASKYRSFDGSCNNFKHPAWGMQTSPYSRLIPSIYQDGISAARTLSKSGNPLTNARSISLALYPDRPLHPDPNHTLVAMQYGQIITHDMSLIANAESRNDSSCCSNAGYLLVSTNNIPPPCFPIVYNYEELGQTSLRCMPMARTPTTRSRNCSGFSRNKPAEQISITTSFLDLSIVYGNSVAQNALIRAFKGGELIAEERNGQCWPPNVANPATSCPFQPVQTPCYQGGDQRINQNTELTVIQILWLREHNRIAKALLQFNPHWDDERLFQETRRIAIAEHQHITYYEYLPIIIGTSQKLQKGNNFKIKGFVDDYLENINPTIINEHANAAFRYFHVGIMGNLELVAENRSTKGNLQLSDWFTSPSIIEAAPDNFDDLVRGLATQPQTIISQPVTTQVTKLLFKSRFKFEFDLKSIDIQRNRDHGLGSYNDMRAFCKIGIGRARTFKQFLDVIPAELVRKLSTLYEHPDDVDLTVGVSLETHVPGTLSGPTILCILKEQFYRTRVGDRFWYEHSEKNYGFTIEQLTQLRKASISRIFCDNGHNVNTMQPLGFIRPNKSNAIGPCSRLPALDLSYWKTSQ